MTQLRSLSCGALAIALALTTGCRASPPPVQDVPVLVLTGGAGSPASTAGTGMAGVGGAAANRGDLPCPIARFLELHCLECHGRQPRMGAPVSLFDAASFQKSSMTGLPLWQIASMRIQSAERPMPPSMLLSAAEIAPVLPWLGAGAPPDPNGCATVDPMAPDSGSTGSPPAAGSGGASVVAGSGAAGQPAVGMPPGTGAVEGDGWPMFGGDLADTRANLKETTITPQNVANLKVLWTYTGNGVTATPAVVDGVVYLSTWGGKVLALDAHSGAQLWMTTLPHLIDSSPAVTSTQIFVGDDQGSVHSLERAHGTLQWSQLVDTHAEAHLWSSPIYVADGDMVLVGVASGEEDVQPPYTFKGSVVALDAKTGSQKWKFYTTTADASSGPGVGVWATVAVDTTRKLAFVGTGNAYGGKTGPHVDSLLALNYQTGMLTWSKQFTAEDVFSVLGGGSGPDFDIGGTANLFNAGGKDLVGVGIKSGDYVALERDGGNTLWTRHVSAGSLQGGIMGSPAYAAGKVFVASNTYPTPQTVTLAALDAATGNVAWMTNIDRALAYGGLLYANGMLFLGTTASVIAAYDAGTGKQLWMAKTPDSIAGGPSIAGGVLYVPWGYMWTLREGTPGNGGLTAYALSQ